MLTSDEYDSSDNESKNDMHIKKFTLSSYNIFSNYINEKKTKKNEISPLLNTSILLREMLRTLLTDIDTVAESTQLAAELAGSGDQTDSPEIQRLILSYDLVKNLERTWHVCEVLFLNSHENTFILEFIHWLKGQHEPFFLAKRLEDLIESASRGTDRSLDGLEHSVDYWPLMMELVSHGRLSHVAQLLGPHSRFARLSQQQPALGREFLEILSSHPYAELVDSEDGPVTAESGLRDVARRLLDWQERASRLQTRWETAAQSVGAVVPELSHLLKILRGDEHALLEESRGSYTRYLLLLLLYKYAPTLSGSDLHSLVRHSLQMCGRVGNDGAVIQYSSSDQADTEQDGMAGVLLACLRGDAGAILRQTYETGIQARDSVPSTASVATQCCVHLGELLVRAGVASEITGPLSTRDGASFLEEVKLQLAEVLNDQMYPIECVQGYLMSCPVRGRELAIKLLQRRTPLTDEDTLRLGRALQQVLVPGCYAPGDVYAVGTPAADVMLARGEYWYQCGNRRGLVRAMFFFQLAGNNDRSTVCLERALWALCATVRACSTLFQGLVFFPDQPSYPIVGYRMQWTGALDETHERIRQKFALDDLSTYWPPRHWPAHYVNGPAWRERIGESEEGADDDCIPIGPVEPAACTLDELREALRFAQDMLGAVRDSQFLNTNVAAVTLTTYTRALSALLSAVEISFKLHDLGLSIALTAQQQGLSIAAKREHVTESVLEACVNCLEKFQLAAIDFHNLLVSRSVPCGYWLHLLDLCVWIDHQAREARNSVRALSALAMQSPVYDLLQQRINTFGPNIFGKVHAYALISALVQLENDSESGQYFAYCNPDDMVQLRASLTSILSATTMQLSVDAKLERARLALQVQSDFLPNLRSPTAAST